VIFVLHSATDIVREHYLMLAIGDHLSFRVDEYQGLHPDLFEKPGHGWHINNTPGVSLMAAVPYALARPFIEPIVSRIQAARARSGAQEPPHYNAPGANSRAFYAAAWRRGLDAKFAFAALVTQLGFMANISALAAVGMFFVLRQLFGSDRTATWLTLLYAFGTPVLFRTAFLNHNLVLGYVAALGFVVLWNPGQQWRRSERAGALLAGTAGGTAVLLDYTGVVMLAGLFAYGAIRRWSEARINEIGRFAALFVLGAAGPLALLWFYQWLSFGNPFLPPQQWMPTVAWSNAGFRGLSFPMPDLLASTLFDYRYGLFVSCPLVLLALSQPWMDRGDVLPRREALFMLALFAAFWLFCGGVNYGRLQYNTGVRYMTAMLPFLFLLSAVVLVRLPAWLAYTVVVASVTVSWCLAMHRDVEHGFGVPGAVIQILIGGFELPVLTTLSRVPTAFGDLMPRSVSPLPLFALTGAAIYGIWAAPPARHRER
jgi:hypothetical protein